MSETAKTIAFLAIGLVAIGVALLTQPSSAELDVDTLVGDVLTTKFDSPEEAKRLRIVRFDEDTATLREFEVAEQDGLWTIPSKDGYPADAARQMAEAATSLMDRKILSVASNSAGDHAAYGVVDPLSPKLEVGQKGVGTHVTMFDAGDDPLVDLIIGKAVKDAEGQRYVRESGRDVVYVIEIDPAKLSTDFEDWIEKDLLKLNPWDLAKVQIKDYSAELIPSMTPDGRLAIQMAWDPRAEMTLAYSDTEGKWTAERLAQFDPTTEKHVEFKLGEEEELNTESLNALKDALDDLAIVDVVRKPQGLSDDLKAGGDFLNDVEAQRSLMTKGFVVASAAGTGGEEIISSDGEAIATLKNGTEYVLRFGNLTNVAERGSEEEEAAVPSGTADDSSSVGGKKSDVHRYLFVMARFNENAVTKPELQDLPALPEDATTQADGEGASADEDAATATDTPAAIEGESTAEGNSAESTETASEASTETPSEGEDAAEPSDKSSTDTERAEETVAEDGEATDDPETKSAELEKTIAERKRIETENQRKLDEYQETLKKGQENVKELNARFGDWYFVVANEVFNKIRLSKDDIVKKKAAGDEAAGAEAAAEAPPAGLPGTAIPGLPQIPGATE